jgi:uncharacterized protein YjbI with pentapeptide repeats
MSILNSNNSVLDDINNSILEDINKKNNYNLSKNTSNNIISSNLNLSNLNLTSYNLTNKTFIGYNFSYSNFSNANLSNTDFTNGNFFKANLSNCNINNTNFLNANLLGTILTNLSGTPINLSSDWTIDSQNNSIIPSNTANIQNMIGMQAVQAKNNDIIIGYQDKNSPLKTNPIVLKVNSVTNSSYTNANINILINNLKPNNNLVVGINQASEITYDLSTFYFLPAFGLLYVNMFDQSASSNLSVTNSLDTEISLNCSFTYILLVKYVNGSFSKTNILVGTKKIGTTFSVKITEPGHYIIIGSNVVNSLTGGDPHIKPIFGEKYLLPNEIKYANLLLDKENNITINCSVDFLKKKDFPKNIYSENEWYESKNIDYIYDYTYYRHLYIKVNDEEIIIDVDTLEVRNLTSLSKIKYFITKPKEGIISIIFNKTYPLLESTKMLKVFIDKYILTFITDINTDERHHLTLDVYGHNINKCYGGMISQDRLLVLDSINEMPIKFYYQSENTIINYLDMLQIPILVN